MRSYGRIENIQKTVNFLIEQTKKLSVEFIGLLSKMYSYVKNNSKNEKTAKGVRKYL